MELTSQDAEDAAAASQELEALSAIYGCCEDLRMHVISAREYCFSLGDGSTSVRIFIPKGYPSREPPTPVLQADSIDEGMRDQLVQRLLSMYNGAEIIFEWIEAIRQELGGEDQSSGSKPDEDGVGTLSLSSDVGSSQLSIFNADADLETLGARDVVQNADEGYTFEPSTSAYGQRRRQFGSEALSNENAVDIIHGEPFTPPGKSTFQGHCATIGGLPQVNWVLRALLEEKKIARATHNIFAYRYVDASKGIQVADNDDDGESGAGAKLASLLELMGANNVLVVVSRWYGGIHLGPDRFKYIAQAARAVLESGGYCKPPKSTRPTSKEATGLRKSRR